MTFHEAIEMMNLGILVKRDSGYTVLRIFNDKFECCTESDLGTDAETWWTAACDLDDYNATDWNVYGDKEPIEDKEAEKEDV
jgi:hypothetical protein